MYSNKNKIINRQIISFLNPLSNVEMEEIEISPLLNNSEIIRFAINEAFKVNIDYPLICALMKHKSKYEKYLQEIKKFLAHKFIEITRTTEFLLNEFGSAGIDFLVFKTVAPFKFYKDDIDIYVKEENFDIAFKILLDNEFKPSSQLKNTVHFDKNSFVQVDLHKKVNWGYLGNSGLGPEMFDLSGFWENRINKEFFGNIVNVPSLEFEILVLNAHSLFQHGYLTLGEILFIGEILRDKQIDVDILRYESSKYGWEELLFFNLGIVEDFYSLHWNIDLGYGFAKNHSMIKNSIVHSSIYRHLKTSAFFAKKQGNLAGLSHFIVYMYRELYYINCRNRLSFNSVPSEIEILNKGKILW